MAELAREYIGWLLMAAAMMLPLTLLSVRHVAFRTYEWRRNRAIAGFLLGYCARWAVAGVVLAPIAAAARALEVGNSWLIPAFGLALAALWQLSPLKARALRRCHRTEALAPTGWRADANCLRFGARVGTNCVLSCWGMMLVPALVPHSVPAMICAQAISTYERYELRRWISPVAWQLGALRTMWRA